MKDRTGETAGKARTATDWQGQTRTGTDGHGGMRAQGVRLAAGSSLRADAVKALGETTFLHKGSFQGGKLAVQQITGKIQQKEGGVGDRLGGAGRTRTDTDWHGRTRTHGDWHGRRDGWFSGFCDWLSCAFVSDQARTCSKVAQRMALKRIKAG